MPPRRLHLFFAFVLGAAAALFMRAGRASVPAAAAPPAPPTTDPPPTFSEPKLRAPTTRHPKLRHRLAVAGLCVVFFAGAAFTAGAGDRVGALLDDGATVESTAEPAIEPSVAETPTVESPAPTAAEPAAEPPAADEDVTSAPEAAAQPDPEPAADASEAQHGHWSAPVSAPASDPAPAPAPLVHRSTAPVAAPAASPEAVHAGTSPLVLPRPPLAAPHADPETNAPDSSAVVWVNAALPDAIPSSARLSRRFARRLRAVARAHGVDWALVLGTYRAEGANGSLAAIAARLHGARGSAWTRVLAGSGRTGVADRAVALAHFDRAVGLAALVHGLDSRKEALSKAVLADDRVVLYPGGRDDVAALRIDVRVLATIEYLANTFGQVTVSSLESGHRLYARPGVVSAHVYGRAVDVAALDGTPIAGNQEPGGLTEDAVRALLLLPPEVRPLQVISLLGLGGPSFPLADHADHIHVGF